MALFDFDRGTDADMRVLIIDDDEDVRDATVACLEIAGVKNVETACDGETGLNMIQAARPGVLLLDLFMPESDGFHVLKQLSDMPASSRPEKVVVISGANDPSMSRGLRELGADEILSKPFRLDDLLDAVLPRVRSPLLAR
jgi:CheY-like chemotaxis protein